MSSLFKEPVFRSKKVRDAAKGEDCTVNSPNCSYDSETTVFCHLNDHWAGKGRGIKAHDIGFFGCYNCHTAIDQGKLDDEYFYLLRAMVRTWLRLIELGIVKVEG